MPKNSSLHLETLVYGVHAALACLHNKNRIIRKIFCSDNIFEKHKKIISQFLFEVFNTKKMNTKFSHLNHQGIVVQANTIFTTFSRDKLSHLQKIVILDKLQDPHNIGAIIRSAAAFNIDAIIIPNNNTPVHSHVISHVASGGCEIVNIVITKNLSQAIRELQKQQFWIVGIDHNGDFLVNELQKYTKQKICLVLGSEGKGISHLIQQKCDFLCKIPMQSNSISSINVSNAAAISFFCMM